MINNDIVGGTKMTHFQAFSNVMARRTTKEHVIHDGKDGLEMCVIRGTPRV